MSNDETERRQTAALNAIREAYGTDEGEESVTLFVSHHLEEIDEDFWFKHCGVKRPKPEQILDLLVLQSHWGEDDEDGIDNFDFTLPDDVTNYLLTVSFDEDGEVSEIAMES